MKNTSKLHLRMSAKFATLLFMQDHEVLIEKIIENTKARGYKVLANNVHWAHFTKVKGINYAGSRYELYKRLFPNRRTDTPCKIQDLKTKWLNTLS